MAFTRFTPVSNLAMLEIDRTEEEIDNSQTQTADVSWWPKVHMWETGSYNMGYWTSFTEVWFKSRLDRIRSHEAQPKSIAAWKNDMKSAHNAKKVKQAMDAASRDFVQSYSERLFSDDT